MAHATIYWTKVAAIGQVAGAAATAAAVVVSLWIVLSERREKLRLIVDRRTIVADAAAPVEAICFEVTNLGVRTARITGFGWRTGWTSWGPEWLKYLAGTLGPSSFSGVDSTPFDLQPGTSSSHLVRLSSIADRSLWRSRLFGRRKVPALGRLYPPLRGVVFTARGTRLHARPSRDLVQSMILLRDAVDDHQSSES